MTTTAGIFGEYRHYPLATISFVVAVWLGQGKLTDFLFQPLSYFVEILGFGSIYGIDAFGIPVTPLWVGSLFYSSLIYFRGVTFAWQSWVFITVLWLALTYFV